MNITEFFSYGFALKYLNDNKNFSNDFEVLVALCRQNKDFFEIFIEYFKKL